MKKLWEKNYLQNKIVEQYCFGNSVVADNKIVYYDAIGSIAHANMLLKIGILTQKEYLKLKKVLLEIVVLNSKGSFVVSAEDEDVHTKIENYISKKLGSLGGKIHTGRSRNDQVLVDLRLYSKDQCFAIAFACLKLTAKFIQLAQKHEYVPMPGYTHMQKAMPSSVGMWLASFAESLLDDLCILETAYQINDQNPLGSGASYGVSLLIDRNLTTKLLGFSKTQNNSLYAQVSRPKSHLIFMDAMTQIMLTLSRFAEDLLLFTTSEFNFFTISDDMTTGSSIMPQKKNLDVLEMVRARAHEVIGYEHSVASIVSGLPSGYNADFGETKSFFFKSIEMAERSIEIVSIVVEAINPNVDVLKKACTPELYAAHAAFLLVKKGMPFRQAYKHIGLSLDSLSQFDVINVLKSSNHVGGPGNLGLAKSAKQIKKKENMWIYRKKVLDMTIDFLKGGEKHEQKNIIYKSCVS